MNSSRLSSHTLLSEGLTRLDWLMLAFEGESGTQAALLLEGAVQLFGEAFFLPIFSPSLSMRKLPDASPKSTSAYLESKRKRQKIDISVKASDSKI